MPSPTQSLPRRLTSLGITLIEPHTPQRRRVVLLGASNLTRGLSTVVDTARQMWQQPLEVLAALGHGRSYGITSRVLGRELPGIVQCGLWPALAQADDRPTTALLTDIGNDIFYGVEVEQILAWISAAVERLQGAGAQVAMTLLPLASVSRLSEWRFNVLRKVLFPSCHITLTEGLRRAHEVHERLIELGSARGVKLVEHRPQWYGFDPIHIRWRHWRAAWGEILSPWREAESNQPQARGSLRRWLYLRTRSPEQRLLFGKSRYVPQPSARLRDGTTVSFF